ncbi:MAG: 3'(2'),5'-bisphosphate nucleotidase CysQ [Chloroflexia bacterium]|nr:3'(2'),5'-bisphosphate nucleotidase CysQ [Chloroflexia bacterium]
MPHREELAAAVAAVRAAGAVVRDYYDGATAATYEKSDGSPVTDADIAADAIIREVLTRHFPDDAILSEESRDDELRLEEARCWIVDPIDGTEQFIARTGEFDILVALVENGRPIAAAGFQPATGVLVTATDGGGAWLCIDAAPDRRIHFDPAAMPIRLGSSKWFGAPENDAIMRAVAERLGSGAARPATTGFSPRLFLAPRALDCMIGVRPGNDQTMAAEWDFAVTDLVIHEAGGRVTDLAGDPFQYNKPAPRNRGGLVAAVDSPTHAWVVAAIEAERGESWQDV